MEGNKSPGSIPADPAEAPAAPRANFVESESNTGEHVVSVWYACDMLNDFVYGTIVWFLVRPCMRPGRVLEKHMQ
jgi:hypothetical protein